MMDRHPPSLLLLSLFVAACGGGGGGDAAAPAMSAATPAPAGPVARTFTAGLEHPWGLVFLPDGSMLVTERPGRLRHVSADGSSLSAPIAGVPGVDAVGQGGLFDVAIDPAFAGNRRVYLSYAEPDGSVNGTAVARATLSTDLKRLEAVSVIFRQLPKLAGSQHFGGRLVFARDGTLFVTLGDRFSPRDEAQNRSNHLGKVVRIATDGTVPADNPFRNDASAAQALWSLGHRNVQGAALHPDTGELWTHEHGPQGGDEVNRTLGGGNYGWPVITYGCEYGSCAPIGEGTAKAGLEQPLTHWVPLSIAPSGMAFYNGDRFPEWRGQLFVGALAGAALWRLELNGNAVGARHTMFADLGERIRDVRQGPDGWLYLLTDSAGGRIVRIER